MPVSKLTIFAMTWAFGSLLVLSSAATSQEELESPADDHKHFVARVGIGLGMTGTKIQRDFSLIDENNFRYDIMGLLNPSVRNELGLTNAQNDLLNEIHTKTKEKMIEQMAPALLTEKRDDLKQMFLDAQEQMRAVFTEQQREQFDAIKHLAAIRTSGLGNYLNSSHFKSNSKFSTAELEELTQAEAKIDAQAALKARKLLKEANRAFLRKLNDGQQERLQQILEDEGMEAFLSTSMFTKRYSAKKPRMRRKADLLRLVKLKSTRTKLDISERQFDEILALDRGESDELKVILDDEQLNTLEASVITSELTRMGTVNALCGGYLVQVLELDDEAATKIFSAGKEIFQKLENDQQSLRQESASQTLRMLPSELQERIAARVGKLTTE